MACFDALCERLKRLFEIKKKQSSKDAEVLNASSIIHVNPFAPIDTADLLTSISEACSARRKRRNGSKLRRILRFSSSNSNSNSSQESNSGCIASTDSQNLISCTSIGSVVTKRYKRDFEELELLGSGEFGSVYRCLNRLDGCVYAVKRCSQRARSSRFAQRRASNEVHANAVLNNCRHVVRYFSAWVEDDCTCIQLEYCNGSDLAIDIQRRRKRGDAHFQESELCRLLLHLAKGLKYIHGMKLAHMDIKPENIFISREKRWTREDNDDDDENKSEDEIVYKIGDLGHVASIINTQELDDEGDCRYLSKEVLRDDYTDLTKADVFALGLTIYETAGGGPLPKNGPAWHNIREGKIKRLERYSNELNDFVNMMIHPNPKLRPSAKDILRRLDESSLTAGKLILRELGTK